MKYRELLNERIVDSSWLNTVTYYGMQNKIFPGEDFLTFKTKTSKTIYICRFTVPGECKRMYKKWIHSGSKGRFWHYMKKLIDRRWYSNPPFQILRYNPYHPWKQ